jgi:hypothetical protein
VTDVSIEDAFQVLSSGVAVPHHEPCDVSEALTGHRMPLCDAYCLWIDSDPALQAIGKEASAKATRRQFPIEISAAEYREPPTWPDAEWWRNGMIGITPESHAWRAYLSLVSHHLTSYTRFRFLDCLRRGEIRAWGTYEADLASLDLVEIPIGWWSRNVVLVLGPAMNELHERTGDGGGDRERRFSGIEVGITRKATVAAETECETWLRELVDEDNRIARPKEGVRKEARGLFKYLSDRGFDRAWDRVAQDHPAITTPGRKPTR